MMVPIRWKTDAFEAKTRIALFERQAGRGVRVHASFMALAQAIALMLRRLTQQVREALSISTPGPGITSGTTASPAVSCDCC